MHCLYKIWMLGSESALLPADLFIPDTLTYAMQRVISSDITVVLYNLSWNPQRPRAVNTYLAAKLHSLY